MTSFKTDLHYHLCHNNNPHLSVVYDKKIGLGLGLGLCFCVKSVNILSLMLMAAIMLLNWKHLK